MKTGRPSTLAGLPDLRGDIRPRFSRSGNAIRMTLEEFDGKKWMPMQELVDGGMHMNQLQGRIAMGQLRKLEREWKRGYQTRIDEALPSERGTKSPRTNTNGSTINRTTDTPKPSSTTLHRTSTGVRRQTRRNGELPSKLRGRK